MKAHLRDSITYAGGSKTVLTYLLINIKLLSDELFLAVRKTRATTIVTNYNVLVEFLQKHLGISLRRVGVEVRVFQMVPKPKPV